MLPGLHKSRHGHDVSLDQYRYIIHVDVQSAGAAIVFSLSWTYSLTQPLQTTGKVGGKVNKLLCTYTVIGTQKNPVQYVILAKPCFTEKNIILLIKQFYKNYLI